jgi:hypothetical protein
LSSEKESEAMKFQLQICYKIRGIMFFLGSSWEKGTKGNAFADHLDLFD